MIKEFTNFLTSLGIDYQDENDGAVTFEYNGLNFLFVSDKCDPNYIRLILPNIAIVDDRAKVWESVNEYNKKYKAAKMIVTGNSIWLSVEQFLYSHDDARVLFKRMLNIIVVVIEDFRTNQALKK